MLLAGLDIGSRNTKLVIIDQVTKEIHYKHLVATGTRIDATISSILEHATGLVGDFDLVAATGYGRNILRDKYPKFSEISCHAEGVLYFYPDCKTVIDIGGQDSKIMTISTRVNDFVMNDKCAAGTGRFLELAAMILGVEVEELSELASKSTRELNLSSTCVVFAETEIIGMLAQGIESQDIIRAVHVSIAKRIKAQSAQLSILSPIIFTGGVAYNSDLLHCLEQVFSCSIRRTEHPVYTGALGAALLLAKTRSENYG